LSDTRIHSLFDKQLFACPERSFLHLSNSTVSYAQLGAQVDVLERELRADGVRLGDRILIVAENCPEHVALVLACSRVGAWSCGVNARMSHGEIKAFAEKADPRMTYFTSRASKAAQQHAQCASATDSALLALQRSHGREGAQSVGGALASQVAAVIFTSGTTGAPKGVLMSHAGLLQFARLSATSRALNAEDLSYAYLPMTHIFGLGTVLLASLHAGAGLLMRSRFDPADVFDALANRGLTNLQGPPAMFTRLLAWLDEQGTGQPSCPNLRYVYTGAAPLDMALKLAVERTFHQPLYHGYGLSEYAGVLCLTKRGVQRRDTSAGYLVEGAELRIVGDHGVDVCEGERGEIWMRGVGLMPGYLFDTTATALVMKSDGWYASGDLGYLAPDGALFVVGRKKEMLIRSGFNVYPGEVEAVLNSFDDIQCSAVVGQRESDGNEAVIAFVQMKAGVRLDANRIQILQTHVTQNLAPYKRPSRYIPIEVLPMTHSGKILKRELQQLLEVL
jgi:acyl-CoA synthetase (AMP-forming)/AMP-acid ligase II